MTLIRIIFGVLWVAFELAVVGIGVVLGFTYLPRIAPQSAAGANALLAAKPSRHGSGKPIIDSKFDALKYALTRRDTSLSLAEVVRRCPPFPPSMSSADFYTARNLILSHPSPWVRQSLIDKLYVRWAAQDCVGAVASALSLASPQLQRLAIYRSLGLWLDKDEPTAWAWVSQFHDASLQAYALERLLKRGTTTGANLAADHVMGIDEPLQRLHLLSLVTREWAKLAPTEARKWVLHLEEAQLRALLLPPLFMSDTASPEQAYDELLQEPNLAVRREAFAVLFAQLGIYDSSLLKQWLAKREFTAEFQRPLFEAASRVGNGSFEEWLELAQALPEGPLRDACTCGITWLVMVTNQPEKVWQHLQTVSACMERNAALTALGKSFLHNTPVLPKEHWINALPASADKDHLLVGMAQALVETQPKLSLEWLTQLQDQAWKQQCLATHFQAWRSTDSPRALAWLWSTPLLTVNEKKSLAQ